MTNGSGSGGGLAVSVPAGSQPDFNYRTDIRIVSSAFVGNTAYKEGGGIWTGRETDYELLNSLVYENTAELGGGIYSNSVGSDDPNRQVRIAHSTIARNTAGHRLDDGTLVITNNLVAGGGVYVRSDLFDTSRLIVDSSVVAENQFAANILIESAHLVEEVERFGNKVVPYFRTEYGKNVGFEVEDDDFDVPEPGVRRATLLGTDSFVGLNLFKLDLLPGVAYEGITDGFSNDPIYEASTSRLLDSTVISDGQARFAPELSQDSGTHFLDCTRMPVLPLLPGSVAIDGGSVSGGGNPTYLFDGVTETIDTDLRGEDKFGNKYDRVVDFPGGLAGPIDAGSYEFRLTTPSGSARNTPTGDSLTIYLDYECLTPAIQQLSRELDREIDAAMIAQIRSGITTQMKRTYGAFRGVTVTDREPEVDASLYDTVVFHPGAISGRLGTSGEYFGDYRNEWTGDVAEVYPNQFGGLLTERGHQGNTTDSSLVDDLIAMLTGTAAHEHGHTAGLQHYDPFVDQGAAPAGTPGDNTGEDGIDPTATAGQQNLYLMATGSTGLDEDDRARLRTFSPQSVAKLEYSNGFSGAWPFQSPTSAELPGLTSTSIGQEIPINAKDRQAVGGLRSVNVIGAFQDDTNDADVYWFEANAGDTISFNALSQSLKRRETVNLGNGPEPFDPVGLKIEIGQMTNTSSDLNNPVWEINESSIFRSNDDLTYSPGRIGDATLFDGSPITDERVRRYSEDIDDVLIANETFDTAGRYFVRVTRGEDLVAGDLTDVVEDYELLVTLKSAAVGSPTDPSGTPYGEVGIVGDFNHDNVVNAIDYLVWRESYGIVNTGTPEVPVYPGTIITAGLGADIADSQFVPTILNTENPPELERNPSPIVAPNGVVDEDDYVAWAWNYGAITGKVVGDYNADGLVDMADYELWARTYGSTTDLRADGTLDQVVNAADYTIWSDTYSSTMEQPAFGQIAVIAGDFNADGNVNQADMALWEADDPSADADGDGNVDLDDYDLVRERLGATTFSGIEGDFNEDGIVDTADYALWASGDLAADTNDDGLVDLIDYGVWDTNFGRFSAGLLPQMLTGEIGVLERPTNAPTILDLAISAAGSNAYSFAGVVGTGEQLRSVPVAGADTVSITFSEEVFVNQSDLLLTNLDGTSPSTVTDFAYDRATQTASWTFDSAFADGRTLLTLSDSLYDLDRESLDGEFFNAWSLGDAQTGLFDTGDGDAGGEFRFHYTILAGDTDRDNVDVSTDYRNWHSTEPGAIYVSTTVDEWDSDLSFGDVSLREAVNYANNATEPTTVYVPSGHYLLTRAGSSETDHAANDSINDLDITGDVAVYGAGPGRTIIDPSGLSYATNLWNYRAFDLRGVGSDLELSGVTLTGAVADKNGTAVRIQNGATAVVKDTAIAANLSSQGAVAVRARGGDITLLRTVVTANVVTNSISGGAVAASPQHGYGSRITIGDSIFALNQSGASNTGGKNVLTSPGTIETNLGGNLFDDAAGGFFDTHPGHGDYLGTPDYVVTSLVDDYDHTDGVALQSIREAVDLANQATGTQEVWLPAWKFRLTRDRTTYGGGSATDIDAAFGDIDVKDKLVVRGVRNRTEVAWKAGVVDSVFDLIGDFNQDGQSDQDVNAADRTVWQDSNGSGSGAASDWEVYAADGDDDGDVDASDEALRIAYYGNSLDLFDVAS